MPSCCARLKRRALRWNSTCETGRAVELAELVLAVIRAEDVVLKIEDERDARNRMTIQRTRWFLRIMLIIKSEAAVVRPKVTWPRPNVPAPFVHCDALQRLIAERDLDVARGLDHLAVRRHEAQAVDGVGDRHVAAPDSSDS